MGNCCKGGDAEESDHLISELAFEEEPTTNEIIKFMLLGAGESGKTTLFKQMKINYVKTYSESDLADETDRIIWALLASFRDYLDAIRLCKGTESPNIEVQTIGAKYFPPIEGDREIDPSSKFPKVLEKDVVEFMLDIWNSEDGKDIWLTRANYKVTDSLEYFMNDLQRFADRRYQPTEMDYLKCRITTAGISEQTFVYRGVKIVVVDVGGQRSERHKWVACFNNLSAILFVASLSAFDQRLFEDTSVFRLPEALDLFRRMLTSALLKNIPVVLFLNKQDLLAEKLKLLEERDADLDTFFPDLELGHNYENAVARVQEHLRSRFIQAVPESERGRIMPHFITATDKGAFNTVFQTAAQIVLREALQIHFQP